MTFYEISNRTLEVHDPMFQIRKEFVKNSLRQKMYFVFQILNCRSTKFPNDIFKLKAPCFKYKRNLWKIHKGEKSIAYLSLCLWFVCVVCFVICLCCLFVCEFVCVVCCLCKCIQKFFGEADSSASQTHKYMNDFLEFFRK